MLMILALGQALPLKRSSYTKWSVELRESIKQMTKPATPNVVLGYDMGGACAPPFFEVHDML